MSVPSLNRLGSKRVLDQFKEHVEQAIETSQSKRASQENQKNAAPSLPEEDFQNALYESNLRMQGFYSIHSSQTDLQGGYARAVLNEVGDKIVKLQSPRSKNNPDPFADLAEKEAAFLSRLVGKPHLAQLEKVFSVSRKRYGFIQKYGGDNLYKTYLDPENPNRKTASLKDIERIAKQLLEALSIIHESLDEDSSILHLDVKPENATENCQGQVSLIDFGLSEELGLKDDIFEGRKFSSYYRPPEVTLENHSNISSDIWALGCTLFTLITFEPFIKVTDDQPDAKLRGLYAYCERLGLDISACNHHDELREAYSDLYDQSGLKQCQRSPLSPFQEVILRSCEKNEKTDQFIDLLEKMFAIDPQQRKTASELLEHPFFTSNLRTDTSFTLLIEGEKKVGMRICAIDGSILLKLNLSDPMPCYHIPKEDFYELQYYDLSDPEQKTIDSQILTIQDNQQLQINTDLVKNNLRSLPELPPLPPPPSLAEFWG